MTSNDVFRDRDVAHMRRLKEEIPFNACRKCGDTFGQSVRFVRTAEYLDGPGTFMGAVYEAGCVFCNRRTRKHRTAERALVQWQHMNPLPKEERFDRFITPVWMKFSVGANIATVLLLVGSAIWKIIVG